jgi:hypothetical protein
MYASFGVDPITSPFNVLTPLVDVDAKTPERAFGVQESSKDGLLRRRSGAHAKAKRNHLEKRSQSGAGASSVGNYFVNSPTSNIQDTVNLRIDHRFSERQSIFARFGWFQRYKAA